MCSKVLALVSEYRCLTREKDDLLAQLATVDSVSSLVADELDDICGKDEWREVDV